MGVSHVTVLSIYAITVLLLFIAIGRFHFIEPKVSWLEIQVSRAGCLSV